MYENKVKLKHRKLRKKSTLLCLVVGRSDQKVGLVKFVLILKKR